jgi:hypothetical protein
MKSVFLVNTVGFGEIFFLRLKLGYINNKGHFPGITTQEILMILEISRRFSMFQHLVNSLGCQKN